MDLPAARLCLGDIPGVSPGLARLVLCHVSDNAHEVVGTIAFAYHSVDAPTIALQTEPNSPDRRGAAPVISQTVKAVLGDGYEQTVPAAAVDSSEIFAPTFGSEAGQDPLPDKDLSRRAPSSSQPRWWSARRERPRLSTASLPSISAAR